MKYARASKCHIETILVIWADERLPRAQSEDLGQSLHQVQKLLKRNQNLALEVDAATPRVEALKEQVAKLSDKPETTDEQSEQIEKLENNLEEKWTSLKVKIYIS